MTNLLPFDFQANVYITHFTVMLLTAIKADSLKTSFHSWYSRYILKLVFIYFSYQVQRFRIFRLGQLTFFKTSILQVAFSSKSGRNYRYKKLKGKASKPCWASQWRRYYFQRCLEFQGKETWFIEDGIWWRGFHFYLS